MQARTSAGVSSSIALIPEEDHDEQDEQDETTDDALHERATGDRWSGVCDADSKCGRIHYYSVFGTRMGLCEREKWPQS